MSIVVLGYEVKRLAPSCFEVKSPQGRRYLVDPGRPACECADYIYRGEERPCKHIRLIWLLARKGVITVSKNEKAPTQTEAGTR